MYVYTAFDLYSLLVTITYDTVHVFNINIYSLRKKKIVFQDTSPNL